jgi:hypothetical protein
MFTQIMKSAFMKSEKFEQFITVQSIWMTLILHQDKNRLKEIVHQIIQFLQHLELTVNLKKSISTIFKI